MALRNLCSSLLRSRAFLGQPRLLAGLVPDRGYREIKVTDKNNELTIEGVLHKEDNSNYVPPENTEDSCPIRSRGIQVTYEDVLILRQFMHSDGEVLPREVTGLCMREHIKVSNAIKMAQRADLLPGSEDQTDEKGNHVPKLNRYLTRFPIGSRNPIRSRGPYWKKRYYKIGDARAIQDAPRIANDRLRDSH